MTQLLNKNYNGLIFLAFSLFFSLNANAQNNQPIAVDDAFSGIVNLAITGDVSTNDSDPNTGNILTYNTQLISSPSSGSVSMNSNGTFTYVSNQGFVGSDLFSYEVCDNGSPILCDTATVSISYASSTNCNVLPDTLRPYYTGVSCTGESRVCVPISPTSPYNIYIDGQPYVSPGAFFLPCGDTISSYNMNNVSGNGPWQVNFNSPTWNDSYFSTTVNSMSDLIDTLNYYVSYGTAWVLNANNTITSNSTYGGYLMDYQFDFMDIATSTNSTITNDYTITKTPIKISAAASLLTITDGTCSESAVLDLDCLSTIDSVTVVHPSSCGVADGSITAHSSNGSTNKEYRLFTTGIGYSAWQTSPVFTNLLARKKYSVQVRNVGSSNFQGHYNINLTSVDNPTFQSLTYTNNTLTVHATSVTGATLEYAISSSSVGNPSYQSSNVFTGYSPGTYYVYIRYATNACEVVNTFNTNTSSINADSDYLDVDYHGNYTINVLNNDTHGLGSTLVTTPISLSNANGTVTLDAAGNLTMDTEYYGIGYFTLGYQACVLNDPSQCDSSEVIINIRDLTIDTMTVTVPLNGMSNIQIHNTGLTWINTNTTNNAAALGCDAQVNNAYIDYNTVSTFNGGYRYLRYYGLQVGSDTTCTVLCSGNGTCDTTILIVNVVVTNTAPVLAVDNFYNVLTNIIPLTGNLLTNDYDPEGDQMAVSIYPTLSPTQGTVVLDTTGAFTYTPNINFSGVDSFQYLVCDNGYPYGLCDSAMVYLYSGNPPVGTPPIITNVVGFNGTCAQNDGTIDISASSPVASLQYSIDSGFTWQASNLFSGLTSGSYNILVFDGNSTSAYSGNPVLITPVIAPIITNVTATNPTNCGLNDAIITVTATGLTGLQYSIDSGITWQNSNTFTGLMAGTYDIIIRNNDGTCQVIDANNPVILTAPNTAVITNIASVNPTHCSNNDGTITITATGSMTLEYSIDGGLTWQNSNNFTGLSCGNYSILVRNNNGTCSVNGNNINLSAPTLSITQVFTTDASCNQNNGGLSVHASGGTNNYEYSITGTTWQTSDTFPNLSAGTYTIYVRDGVDTVTYGSPVTINNVSNAPTFLNATMYNDSLFIAANQNGQAIQFSIDCGITWQNSSVFFPAPMGNLCIGLQNIDGSCPIFNNVTISNTAPIAVTDSVSLTQNGYVSFNVLNNDYDIENNLFVATPQVQYYGSDSMTLNSSGVMTIPTNALNLGSYMISYQICEVYNPTNCSQGNAYFTIVSPTDTFHSTIAIGATQAICIPTLDLPGTPVSAILNCGLFTNIQIDSIVGACAYVYADDYGSDTSCIIICDNFGFCDTTIFIITVEDGVWPGDTDDDTYANNFDLLNIGLGFGLNGTPRNSISNNWNGFITPNWGQATPITNIDYRHADSNGDGFINNDDTIAILQNYGSSYQRRGAGGVLGATPLYVKNDTAYQNGANFSLPIILGEANNQAIDLYGGAFSISYDTAIVEAHSVRITFDTSWAGMQNINMISINKNLENEQQIDAAFTRTNGLNITGHGIVAKLDFTIKDDILRRGLGTDSIILALDVFNVKFISNDESPVDVNPNTTNIVFTDIDKVPMLDQYISVFPNPANNYVQIETDNIEIEQITILDINGRIIHHTTHNTQNNITLDVATYTSGVYMLQIQTSKGIATKRLTVIRE